MTTTGHTTSPITFAMQLQFPSAGITRREFPEGTAIEVTENDGELSARVAGTRWFAYVDMNDIEA